MTDMRAREMKWEGSTVLIMIISPVLALAKMNQRYNHTWNVFDRDTAGNTGTSSLKELVREL